MLRLHFNIILSLTGLIATSPVSQAAPKPILVHTLPWYVAPPHSTSWGWHWTMNHFNPENVDTQGRRAVASHYYPLIGPYDSADPVVLEYHVLLMKLAGIDGVIVDWYGRDRFADYAILDERTQALFDFTRRAGLLFSLCYEDQTVQHEIDGGFIPADNALGQGQAALLYAQTRYFADPSYLRRNGRPVLLNFGPQHFVNNSDWETLFSVLDEAHRPVLFTLDKRLPVGEGGFSWPPMWLSATNDGVVTPTQLETYLDDFERNGPLRGAWPAFASSAFPRFHDIYAQAQVGTSYGTLDDRNGETFRATLTRALTNDSAFVQLATWNDFGEGTMLEPTREYGYRDLAIVQDLRRRHLDDGFANTLQDLALPKQLYDQRRMFGANARLTAELDRVFTNLVTGALGTARAQLTGLESQRPVIYGCAIEANQLQFNIGGYLEGKALSVQRATDGLPAEWKTIDTLEVDSGLTTYQTVLPSRNAAVFFRVGMD